jgi:hypothetical protein
MSSVCSPTSGVNTLVTKRHVNTVRGNYSSQRVKAREGTDLADRFGGAVPDCRHELVQLWGDLALLALSAIDRKPPLRSRERPMASVDAFNLCLRIYLHLQ